MTTPNNSPSTNRRDFLAATSAVTAASLLSPGGVFAAGNGTLKVGLVGCGGRGTGAATNALNADPGVKITALADVFPEQVGKSLNLLAREYPGRVEVPADRQFSGFDAYQQLLKTDVDVVLLCTPPGFRPQHLKAAVEAGKHIFCEKPMAVDAVGVRSVIETSKLAKQKKLNLVGGFCYRYDLPKRETIKRIHDGAIGDVLTIHTSYNTGTIWHRGSNPKWSEMEYQMRNWYYFTWLSGDHYVEQHIHSIDKALWVMKDQHPVSAVALGGRQQRTDEKYGNIWDHFSVIFEYANGAKVFTNTRQQAGCYNEVTDYVYGTKGIAELMSHKIDVFGGSKWNYSGDAPNMYDYEHVELFQAIRKGTTINDGETMTASTLMGIMGRMAAYTGKKITWEEALNSKESLVPSTFAWGANPVPPIAIPGKTKFA
ncbi:Gfo/Idh/MocA family protein [Tuwongella immobilis]|uniref:Gfo/Idh/MocA-like oxidoreductase N-terminal domain-containing protein n=1 Tax=Tuwongella immobilis TaxID=692036 RepID=A0A6C2YVX7_9BACT|nr:Gfo/Idh/MocA family oxidoreductase [Tuwongella immobilis]VIP05780.1 oxidoreductase : Oxidoreductase domain protein OS=Pirellula staleyi (strain ATCC 27377 / DSM 6068 / ICPB 4128) GN=Psta_4484 PE=4 SV=1: GFO_IDH_MocA [Tuwongella immobilis]VTS08916.1 oxidoreductase : Oxidoreductase domain protein OS=Pirellula staleyi (strain ATCC 27377 / DSM 6068 / ICPB 4128) GN=Psta_4484 PE=4 SV=1: GFO_IDH_MocA [Tuwongella immobilis]